MRILVVNWQDRLNPEAGGAEVHLHEIFGRLVSRGHEVTLLVSGWEAAPPEAIVDGMRVVRRGTRYSFPLHVRSGYRSITANQEPFDVLVEDINKLPLFTPVWTNLPVVGLVPHLFGSTAFQQESIPVAATVWAAERLMPATYRNRNFVVISESTAADLAERGFQVDRIHVSYPGIDHAVFTPAPVRAQEPTVVYVGRLRRYKGIDLVIQAVALLAAKGKGVRLLIVGQGDDAARLERIAEKLGLGNSVSFRGFVPEQEKVEILRSAWVNVYPSPKEGWGITNVEAAACGTPSVASDSPGLRESVLDGQTGFLVEHENVDAWARALERLVEDPGLRERMGAKALEHSGRFTWEATTEELEGILQMSASG
ncbi:MAG: glycosyltransferase family 4 protein [Gemmatimonadetes bacterium]|nr:glycosyltransferase family 4 protein [Gemmatimonadota bacterium]